MKLENAELKHIERIVAISKAAFDSDINVNVNHLRKDTKTSATDLI